MNDTNMNDAVTDEIEIHEPKDRMDCERAEIRRVVSDLVLSEANALSMQKTNPWVFCGSFLGLIVLGVCVGWGPIGSLVVAVTGAFLLEHAVSSYAGRAARDE